MILTDKAKDLFYDWYEKNIHVSKLFQTRSFCIVAFLSLHETCQNALIIDFLIVLGFIFVLK